MLFAINSLHVLAKTPNEISIYGGGGYSRFIFQPSSKDASSKGFYGDFGTGFTSFITPKLGFHIGAGFAMYNLTAKKDSLSVFTPDLIDSNGYTFDLFSELFGYRETHRIFCLSIPLMIQIQTEPRPAYNRRLSTENCFYAMAGAKVNIVVKSEYDMEIATLYNKAYYPLQNNWAGTQKFAGLGVFNGNNADGNLKYILPVFSLEAGMKWRIASAMYLYTGAFFDYGPNSFVKNDRDQIKNYTSPRDFENLALLELSDNMNIMTAGIKLRLTFIKRFNPISCPAIQQQSKR